MPAGEYGCDCDYPAPSGYSGVNCDEDYHECFYEPCGELYAGKGTQKGVCRDSHSNTLYDAKCFSLCVEKKGDHIPLIWYNSVCDYMEKNHEAYDASTEVRERVHQIV